MLDCKCAIPCGSGRGVGGKSCWIKREHPVDLVTLLCPVPVTSLRQEQGVFGSSLRLSAAGPPKCLGLGVSVWF